MSARISTDNADRALIAAGRMLAGTLAAVVVALGTLPLGQQLSGSEGPDAYAGAALLFALIGGPLLVGVGLTYRDAAIPASTERRSVSRAMILTWRNRAFVTLALAMVAMVAAVTMLDKSVLYYFKYVLVDPSGGQLTLGAMMAVGGLAVPVWLVISRATGVRAVWFLAVTACLAGLAMFVFGDVRRPGAVQTFLVAVQAAVVGLHFSVWALLPGAIDYGHRGSGVRVEAVLYGYTALLQRLAIGLGTVLLGVSLGGHGAHLPAADDAAYRLAIAGVPLALFGFAGLVMLFSPLRGEGKARDAPLAVPMPAD
jgi:GPH family glycoside/pentoside/hexuronide:cation symporter